MAEAVPTYGRPWTALKPTLSKTIMAAVSSLGFENTTPVQESTIPAFLQNSDVVVEAATGSGKTLAFIIPVLEVLQRKKVQLAHGEIGAVIISPTRELARQISTVLDEMIRLSGLNYKAHLVVGGSTSATNTADEIFQLKEMGPDILVGTPGRLEDILCGRLKRGKKTKSGMITATGGVRGRAVVSGSKLEVLVLDEADRLLDMGFEASLTAILSVLPKQRRTGLFSATMSEGLSQLVRAGLRNPVRVQVKVKSQDSTGTIASERRIPSTLNVQFLVCPPDRKLAQILRFIQTSGTAQKYIVYFSTCAAVDYFFKLLRRLLRPMAAMVPGGKQALKNERQRLRQWFDVDYPISVHSLHGQMVQKKRQATYDAFAGMSKSEAGILLCTDVASRGLDIPDVDCVIQWDPPTDPKTFAHRCGRTARAGRSGSALVFINPGSEETYVDFLALRKIPMSAAAYLWQDADGNITTKAPAGEPAVDEESEVSSDADSSNEVEAKDDEEKEQPKKRKKRRGVLCRGYLDDAHSDGLIEMVQSIAASDREIYERGKIAFVSFVQSYLKHEALYIFRAKELPIIEVGKGFGLLHMPSMPELRGRPLGKFKRFSIDTDTIPYLDGKREERRQSKLKVSRRATAAATADSATIDCKGGAEEKKKEEAKTIKKDAKINEAWASAREARELAKERKLKRIKRRDAKASAEEEKLLREINDPEMRKMLAKDPLLAKRLLYGRDKSLRDMMAKKAEGKQRQQQSSNSKISLGQIIEEARKTKNDSSSSSEDEKDWEELAGKQQIKNSKRRATGTKRKRFSFNPGFSDEEDSN